MFGEIGVERCEGSGGDFVDADRFVFFIENEDETGVSWCASFFAAIAIFGFAGYSAAVVEVQFGPAHFFR
jgi:hypothetical protein